MLRNGTLAHRHPGMLAARGLTDITVEAHTLLVRDPTAVDHVLGLRTWAVAAANHGRPEVTAPQHGRPQVAAAEDGRLDATDARDFQAQFDEAVATGRFTYAVTFFLTAGTIPVTKPGDETGSGRR